MSTISTEQLMAVLERTKLLQPPILAELKRRVAKAPTAVDPRSITKWLVVNKHISVAQSLDLLAGKPVNKSGSPTPKPAQDDELGFAEDADKLDIVEDVVELLDEEELEEASDDLEEVADDLEPIDAPEPKSKSTKKPIPPAKPPAGGRRSVAKPMPKKPLLVDDLPPLDGGMPGGDPLSPGFGARSGTRPAMAATMRLGAKPKPGQGKNVWDSPFLLIGGGGLLGLVILAAALYWALGRQSGEEALQMAEDDYQGGSYSQAINKYDQYLKKFPDHKGVSIAKVHRGLAQMRQAVESSGDWPKTLELCKQVLNEITTETEFPEARSELAALLPRVAEGLAEKARVKPADATIVQSEESLALIEKYVPVTMRPEQQMQDVRKSLALSRKALARDESLAKVLGEIKDALARGKPAAAYAVRKDLLKAYPDLSSNQPLQEAILAVSQSEKKDIVFTATNKPALTVPAASPLQASLALVTRTPGVVAGADGRMTFALAEGAAYGVEVKTGRVAWRRFLGFDAQHPPQASLRGAGPLALAVDSVSNELVCLDSPTGKLKWRQPLSGAADAAPTVLRDRVLQPLRDGSLAYFDLESGAALGAVKIPHRLSTAPAFDQREQHLYQVADDSTLYILSAQSGACEAVVYLGHEAGTIRTPPLLVSRYLILAENHLARGSRLRVFLTDEKGQAPKQIQELQLEGHVLSPPQMVQRTLVAITDLGAQYAFDVGGVEKKEPLTKLAAKPATDAKGLVRHCYSRGSEFWVGDAALTHYEVLGAQGRLTPKWVKYAGDVFLQPLEAVGDALISVRRRAGVPGAVIAAVSLTEGAPLWETHLASPTAGPAAFDAGGARVTAMNLLGGLFRFPVADLKDGVLDSGADARSMMLPPLPKEGANVTLPDGSLVFTFGTGSTQGMLVEKDATAPRVITWPAPLSVAPTILHGSLLMPAQSGQVMLLDGLGRLAGEPFQPPLESGERIAWQPPGFSADGEAVLGDGGFKLYRLGYKDQPRPNVAMLGQFDLRAPVISATAVVESTAYCMDDTGKLLSFSLPGLAPGPDWDLKSRAAWGPGRVGDLVLLATLDEKLLCLDGKQQLLWQIPLPYGALAGAPLPAGDNLVLCSNAGTVWSVSKADGKELAKASVGQPFVTGPLEWNGKLVISGHDGTLHVVNMP